MLQSSGEVPSWPLNQLACICRKIGASARSCAGVAAGGGGAGGIAARAAPQPDGFGLTGGGGGGIFLPSGVTKPTATCNSGDAGWSVGYAMVGELIAAGAAGAA